MLIAYADHDLSQQFERGWVIFPNPAPLGLKLIVLFEKAAAKRINTTILWDESVRSYRVFQLPVSSIHEQKNTFIRRIAIIRSKGSFSDSSCEWGQ